MPQPLRLVYSNPVVNVSPRLSQISRLKPLKSALNSASWNLNYVAQRLMELDAISPAHVAAVGLLVERLLRDMNGS